MMDNLDINSLELLEKALYNEDVTATLVKTSLDSTDADHLKPSIMNFRSRDKRVGTHLESGQ